MKNLVPNRDAFLRWESVGTRIVQPFQTFTRIEAAGGIMILTATVVALVWANSSFSELYNKLLHFKLGLTVGGSIFNGDVHFVVSEGLMSVFFLVIGLEIKRELLVGELTSPRKAALPAIAALGGVVAPAVVYLVFNLGTPAARGWAIPMATDIAFVLATLTMLGARVPSGLAVFLVSLAIVDDLCAVIIIALFYSGEIYVHFLAYAGTGLLGLILLNVLGFRHPVPYALLGLVVWVCTYFSGVHVTFAGVLIAFTIPCRSKVDKYVFSENAKNLVGRFTPGGETGYISHLSEDNQAVVRSLERLCTHIEPPLQRLEYILHPWVTFAVMPLFALTNAGIEIDISGLAATLTSSPSLGVILGLFAGKQIGIFGAVWIAVKAGVVDLPEHVGFRHIYGGSILCGIGFTMSLFIADLSFQTAELLDSAKLSVLLGSLLSVVAGTIVLITARNPGVRGGGRVT